MDDGTTLSRSRSCRRLTHLRKDRIRYGCKSNKRTQADTFAYVVNQHGNRVPVQILELLSIELDNNHREVCAIAQPLTILDEDVPWSLYTPYLGITISPSDTFGAPFIIPVTNLDSPVAVIPTRFREHNVLITVSMDRVNEPGAFDWEDD
ncbi:hypothetical protein BDN72DRAFT_906976 [Pluteus cervinus]|uniref:Uncharacterized protein n=1 Tax=Pluteus cervinus TaxID=181527 RepID=A0ACD2ZXP8_9AGAR|nr:hypothetical protein BDN72DRAFT_906976 [Pluteus cervinus]